MNIKLVLSRILPIKKTLERATNLGGRHPYTLTLPFFYLTPNLFQATR